MYKRTLVKIFFYFHSNDEKLIEGYFFVYLLQKYNMMLLYITNIMKEMYKI